MSTRSLAKMVFFLPASVCLLLFALADIHAEPGEDVSEYREDYSLHSRYGELFICDVSTVHSFDEDIRPCVIPGKTESDDDYVFIVFNEDVIWSDSSRKAYFQQKFTFANTAGEEVEIFLFLTSTGGTACPLELTAVVISEQGYKVHGPFGNCMDTEGIQIKRTEDGLNFLFECGLNPDCENYAREFAYYCFVSKDIEQTLQCEGASYCSSYSYSESSEVDLFYWDKQRQAIVQVNDCTVVTED